MEQRHQVGQGAFIFSWLQACLCHPDPSVRHLTQINCDKSHPPQLEIHRRYLSEGVWSQCIVIAVI